MSNRILALDIGTSSAKAVLFGAAGQVLGDSSEEYPTQTPAPGWQEQDPPDWWRAAVVATRAAIAGQGAEAVVLTGAMQNVIPLSETGEPVRPAMLYSDSRAAEVLERVRPELAAIGAGRILGNEPDPLLSIFKLVWLRDHEPRSFAATRTLLTGTKDYVVYRLTGSLQTDPTQATTTGMMDLVSRDWSTPVLACAGVEPDLLPPILPATSTVGTVTRAAAAETHLTAGIPVINGCGDAGASTIGAGVTAPGDVYVYLGTSGWVACIAPLEPGRDPLPVYTLAHPLNENVIEIAAILSAAGSVAWLRGVLAVDGLDALETEAAAVDAKPGTLLFLPYLIGERNPFHDTAVRGGFLGLDSGHGRGALFYAVMEGVACAIRNNLEALAAAPSHVRLLGGAGQSRLWPQIIADILGIPVHVAAAPAVATALGAYRIAAQALGLDLEVSTSMDAYAPRPGRRKRAGRQYRRFLEATEFARRLVR